MGWKSEGIGFPSFGEAAVPAGGSCAGVQKDVFGAGFASSSTIAFDVLWNVCVEIMYWTYAYRAFL